MHRTGELALELAAAIEEMAGEAASVYMAFLPMPSKSRDNTFGNRPPNSFGPTPRANAIDADLGQSGASTTGRDDFTTLTADVALGHVGIIFGWEVSRLARNNADWYHLLDLASVVGALIADNEGVYDPRSYNDRLLLGLYVIYHLERSGR